MKRLASALVLAACGSHATTPADALADGAADARVDAAPDAYIYPTGPWSTPVLAFAAMSDDDPTLTDDLLEMYFNRGGDIFVVRRASVTDAWSTPSLVTELSSTSNETTPEVSGDGLTIYVSSRRTPTAGQEDIWVATRASRSDAWGAPVHVTELSSSAFDGAATPSADGLSLVLYSARDGTPELYETTRASSAGTWSTPALHTELSSGIADEDPMLSSDKRTIYYDSSVSGGGDLFIATRSATTGAFDAPVAIDSLNTTLYLEEDPWVSPDGHQVFFASNRDGAEGIYESSR